MKYLMKMLWLIGATVRSPQKWEDTFIISQEYTHREHVIALIKV
jgi:hypothetical protein